MKADSIKLTVPYVGSDVQAAIQRVLESGVFVKGPEGKAFEREFARYCGARHGVAVNSGTSALFLAFRALGIGAGDEVIVPSHTFAASVAPLTHLHAKPVFAEVDKDTYTLDPASVAAKITPATKALLAVHLYGHPCELDLLRELCEKHGLYLVEDAAQAHGATYKGKKVGVFGEAACFSFYPSKNLSVLGEGGMVLTNREEFAELVAALRDHGRGSGKKYVHKLAGYNFRLSELHAAIGRAQLKHLDSWLARRREVASWYREGLADAPRVQLPVEKDWARHAYHLYVVRCSPAKTRGKLRSFLARRGIETGVHYPVPVHKQPGFACSPSTRDGSLSFTEKLAEEVLSLPMHPALARRDVARVAAALRSFLCESQ